MIYDLQSIKDTIFSDNFSDNQIYPLIQKNQNPSILRPWSFFLKRKPKSKLWFMKNLDNLDINVFNLYSNGRLLLWPFLVGYHLLSE